MNIIASVINDLSTDQRIHKTCMTLQEMGFKVLLIGRQQKQSQALAPRRYKTFRMPLLFEKGPLFYLFFQVRLFFQLLFRKVDVLVANDLDTLFPNYLVSKIKRIPLVYDTHELFCEVPELQQNPLKKKIWKGLERFLFPKMKYVFTVNDSIAKIYQEEYKIPVQVIRNMPRGKSSLAPATELSRAELGLPEDKKIIILQGAGINMDRGAEEAVGAMRFIEGAMLLIIGSGDVIPSLKKMVSDQRLEGKVRFVDKIPFSLLGQYTRLADIGLTLDKDSNINYRYSLPNKLFDYIHAGIPVIGSDLVEVRRIIEQYKIGAVLTDNKLESLAEVLQKVLYDPEQMKIWKENTKLAARELCWEMEEGRIMDIFKEFLFKRKLR